MFKYRTPGLLYDVIARARGRAWSSNNNTAAAAAVVVKIAIMGDKKKKAKKVDVVHLPAGAWS